MKMKKKCKNNQKEKIKKRMMREKTMHNNKERARRPRDPIARWHATDSPLALASLPATLDHSNENLSQPKSRRITLTQGSE